MGEVLHFFSFIQRTFFTSAQYFISFLHQRKCSIYILDMNFVAQFPFIMISVSYCLIRFFLSIFILHCINIIQYRYAECCTNTMDSVTSIYMYRFVFHRSLHLASHRTLLQDQYRSGWAQTHWRISLIKVINSSEGLKSFCNSLPRIPNTSNTFFLIFWKTSLLGSNLLHKIIIEINLLNFLNCSPSNIVVFDEHSHFTMSTKNCVHYHQGFG